VIAAGYFERNVLIVTVLIESSFSRSVATCLFYLSLLIGEFFVSVFYLVRFFSIESITLSYQVKDLILPFNFQFFVQPLSFPILF